MEIFIPYKGRINLGKKGRFDQLLSLFETYLVGPTLKGFRKVVFMFYGPQILFLVGLRSIIVVLSADSLVKSGETF